MSDNAPLLCVSLGNPGPKYELTRHNAGFLVLDELLDKHGITLGKSNYNSQWTKERIYGESCIFQKPLTYMNLSGRAVAPLMNFFKIPPSQLIVLHDEVDLEPGCIRVKKGGGAGGHKGIRSIIQETGQRDFIRIRLGIGRPLRGDVSSFVLNQFSMDEQKILESLREEGAKIIQSIIKNGVPVTQNRFHRKSRKKSESDSE